MKATLIESLNYLRPKCVSNFKCFASFMFYGSFSKLDTCNPAPYLKDIRGEKFRFPAPDCLKYDVTGFECTDLGQEWSNFNIFSPKCWIYFKLSNGRWYKGVWLEFQNINFLWRKGVRSRRYATFWDLVPKWRHFRWVNYEKFTLSVNPTVRGWGVISLTLWNVYITLIFENTHGHTILDLDFDA